MERDEHSGSPGADSGALEALDVIPLHSTDLLTVLDDDGTILYESPAIEQIFGFEQDELVGDQVAQYFHPDDRDTVIETYRTVVTSQDDTIGTVEYRHEQADGSYCWVESVASSDPTPDGNYVVNTRDVSDRKTREQQLEASNTRLEEFAKVVSHDLRNPLTVAQGRVELAKSECQSEHLDAIAHAHERMESLIDDLLSLAQLGTQTQDKEPIDLSTLCETCWDTIATHDADLDIAIDGTIRADRSRVRQLLENLLANAIDHGGTDVSITIGALPDQAGFYVADDGPGIEAQDRDRVFESGFSTRDDGTGFGLTIVTQIVDAHEWDIELAESRAGGARFEITGIEFLADGMS